jgi:hypothetical protein
MKAYRLRSLSAIGILLLSSVTASADSMTYAFSTDPPSGNIMGTDDSTIGWGYSIINNSLTDWLVTTNLASDPFADGIPVASLFDFPIIAPGATASLAYDPAAATGLFSLTWNADAPIGFTNSGVFTLDAEWWTGDPFAGGSFIQDAAEGTAAYSATVSSPSSVPEPNIFFVLTTVLMALFICHRRIRTSNSS